ncbi:hypothetical protein [Corallococcus exiguus]|uniref:hypothetical protein n=1 Tax=Corallococcus exiguus TaxID=83462 RepID=UPI001494B8CC|nr:hypothetical protein [Corallococcus exiguus]NPD28319.1 hypothetical protein [Corallococcus exiguus]
MDDERADEFLPQLLIELGQQRAQLLALRLAPSPSSGLPIAAQAVVPSPNAATANPAAPLVACQATVASQATTDVNP